MGAAIGFSSREQACDHGHLCFENIVEYLDSSGSAKMSHSELERELEIKGRELMRLLLQEHLDKRGPGHSEEPVCGSDGVERTRKRPHDRKLETIFGTVTVNRTGYGKEGVESLHPLDAELNLPKERYSFELRRRAAEEAAKNSFDETLESIVRNTGGKVPKRQVEELVRRAAVDFDDFYETRRHEAVDDMSTGPILVISSDGKGVVMLKQDLREQTRKAAEKRANKMDQRLSSGEKKNSKRMATVATVYTIEPFERAPENLLSESGCTLIKEKRPRPEKKRVWASLEKNAREVIEDAFCEACARDPVHEKKWVALVDGDKNQLRILNDMVSDNELTVIVDIIHVIEYLWDAGRAFHPVSGPELEDWVRHRLLGVLQGKASLMAGGMRRSATRQGLSVKKRKLVDKCATYLINNAPYLNYANYLSQGFPISTGVIEGACRHLVKDRMDITGARWRLKSAEAVLRLRALRSSHDFDEYWKFHEVCEYERNHRSSYVDGVVPATIDPHKTETFGHLTVIK